jgi:hypothetical protein
LVKKEVEEKNILTKKEKIQEKKVREEKDITTNNINIKKIICIIC